MQSVLQDWVMELPLREQGTILTAIRGCDVAPKEWVPETGRVVDTQERRLTAFIRYCCLNPADVREIDVPGSFFQSTGPLPFKPSGLGHYPLHWVSHIMHTFEVIAYRHPAPAIAGGAWQYYLSIVHSLHLNVETREQMSARLSEDRIKTGTVVS